MWVCGLTQEAACSGAETVSGWLILKIWKQDRTMWQDLNACNSLKTVYFGMVVKEIFRGGFRPPEPPLQRGDGAVTKPRAPPEYMQLEIFARLHTKPKCNARQGDGRP